MAYRHGKPAYSEIWPPCRRCLQQYSVARISCARSYSSNPLCRTRHPNRPPQGGHPRSGDWTLSFSSGWSILTNKELLERQLLGPTCATITTSDPINAMSLSLRFKSWKNRTLERAGGRSRARPSCFQGEGNPWPPPCAVRRTLAPGINAPRRCKTPRSISEITEARPRPPGAVLTVPIPRSNPRA